MADCRSGGCLWMGEDCTVIPSNGTYDVKLKSSRTGMVAGTVPLATCPIVVKILGRKFTTLDTPEYSLEFGFSSVNAVSFNKSKPKFDFSNIFYSRSYYQSKQNKFANLKDNDTVAFRLVNKTVHIFINGVLLEKETLETTPPANVWPVIRFCGVSSINLSTSVIQKARYVCSTTIEDNDFAVKSGTEVKLCLLKEITGKQLSKLCVDLVWVEVDDSYGGLIKYSNIHMRTREMVYQVAHPIAVSYVPIRLQNNLEKTYVKHATRPFLLGIGNNNITFEEAMRTKHSPSSIIRIVHLGPDGSGDCIKRIFNQPSSSSSSSPNTMSPKRPPRLGKTSRSLSLDVDDSDGLIRQISKDAVSPTSSGGFSSINQFLPTAKRDRSSSQPLIQRPVGITSNPDVILSGDPSLGRNIDPSASLPANLSACKKDTSTVIGIIERLKGMISIQTPDDCIVDKNHIMSFLQLKDIQLLPYFLHDKIVITLTVDVSSPSLRQEDIDTIEEVTKFAWSFMKSKSRPYLLIVTTQDRTKNLPSINKQLSRILQNVKDICLFLDGAKSEVIFPLNTASDQIYSNIERFSSVDVAIPLSYQCFDLKLKEYSENHQQVVVSLDECYRLGYELCMSPEDVIQSLKYLNILNRCLYFEKFDIVFVSPQVFVELFHTLLDIKNNRFRLLSNIMDDFVHRGMLPKVSFEFCMRKAHPNHFIPQFQPSSLLEKFVDSFLTVSLNNNHCYFFPSCLPMADSTCISDLRNKFVEHLDPLLLLPCKGVLLNGIFITLIKRLLDDERGIFQFSKTEQIYSNAVILTCSYGGSVLLVEYLSWLEICYSGSREVSHNVAEIIKDSISQKLSPGNAIEYFSFERGFWCTSCQPCFDHPAKVNRQETLHSISSTCMRDFISVAELKKDIRKIPWLFGQGSFEAEKPMLPDLMNQVGRELGPGPFTQLAIQLKLGPADINGIMDQYKDRECADKYSALFDKWEQSDCSPYTWKTMLDALKNINQPKLYAKLCEWLWLHFSK